VTEKPAAGCALLIPGSGKPNQVKTTLILQSLERMNLNIRQLPLHCTYVLIEKPPSKINAILWIFANYNGLFCDR
jgi:hypothetical protein